MTHAFCFAIVQIGADGFRSLVRQTAGFHTIKWDYNQFAVVATLQLPEVSANISCGSSSKHGTDQKYMLLQPVHVMTN